jgi:hypothetical protein
MVLYKLRDLIVPKASYIESNQEFSFPVIILVVVMVAGWSDVWIVAKKELECVGAGTYFQAKRQVGCRIIGWMLCNGLIVIENNCHAFF